MLAPDSDRVLVLDADGQAGLSLVRSLGRHGVAVTAGSSARRSLGGLSRYSAATYHHPDATHAASAFLDHLVEFLEREPHFVVVPVRDQTSVLLAKHRSEIERTGTRVATESWPQFERAYDKGQLFQLAESLSVPIPVTFYPRSVADVAAIADDVPYPALVKPRSKTTWDAAGRCHYTQIDDTYYVDSPTELVETYRRLLAAYPVLDAEDHYPLVQEVIEGMTTTTVVLADDGDVLTHFQEKRLRTYPASGGNSTLLRALHEPRMLAYAREVIAALAWTGPAMVEFMETPEGEYVLIEVNGRYWGSVPFAIDSGVDIPWLHYQQLRGLSVEAPTAYATNRLHHRLLYGDLKWLDEQLRAGNRLAPLHVLWACLVAHQTFVSATDPLPTGWSLCQAIQHGGSSVLGRLFDADADADAPAPEAELAPR